MHTDPFWKALGTLLDLRSLTIAPPPQPHYILKPVSPKNGTNVAVSRSFLSCIHNLIWLQSLTVTHYHLGSVGAAQVLAHLPYQALSHLQHLNLSANNIGTDRQVLVLAQQLAKLTALRSLNVSENPLQDAGIVALAPAIAPLSLLHSLDVSCCDIKEDGSMVLFRVLARCTGLMDFRCSRNNGSTRFLVGLASCAHLQHLELPEFEASADICSDVEQFLAVLTCLTSLHVSYPFPHTLEGVSALEGLIPKLPSLQELHFSHHSQNPMMIREQQSHALVKLFATFPSTLRNSFGQTAVEHFAMGAFPLLEAKVLSCLPNLSMECSKIDNDSSKGIVMDPVWPAWHDPIAALR